MSTIILKENLFLKFNFELVTCPNWPQRVGRCQERQCAQKGVTVYLVASPVTYWCKIKKRTSSPKVQKSLLHSGRILHFPHPIFPCGRPPFPLLLKTGTVSSRGPQLSWGFVSPGPVDTIRSLSLIHFNWEMYLKITRVFIRIMIAIKAQMHIDH